MTILINEQEVDFTLETEENAFQIYEAINSWLKESCFLLYSFEIDGIETDPDDKTWKKKPAIEINQIKVTALSEKEYLLTGLLTVAEYINLLLRAVSSESSKILTDLMEEYPSIIKNIPVLVKGSQGLLICEHMNKILKNSGLLDTGLKSDYKENFLNEFAKIAELINSAAREIEDPKSELQATFNIIKTIIPEINEISILLQTGKDQQAMNLIIKLTELLQKFLHIISIYNTDNINIGGESFYKYSTDLNSILNELAEAFDANDSVLIGDLLEYEIAPKLELLPEIIDSIKLMED